MINFSKSGNLDPFLSVRKRAEKEIRDKCSEHVILEVHDAAYSQVKQAISPIHDAVETALHAASRADSESAPRTMRRRALAKLRDLLERNAKERELQDALFDSGLLAQTCKVVQEVAIRSFDNCPRMRMDLVLVSQTEEPSEIVELKRGCHLLLARRGKPTERLSQQLTKAIKQIQRYGEQVESDTSTAIDLRKGFGIQGDNLVLRLIAGRRLSNAQGYSLLNCAEADASTPSLQLQIYTWDGLLAELERICD